MNDAPIKIGLNTVVNPSEQSMKNAIDKAVDRAKIRKKNKEMPWLKEIENQEARRIVNKMRENGTIVNSSCGRKTMSVQLLKNLARIARAKNLQGVVENENDYRGIGEDNRKVA